MYIISDIACTNTLQVQCALLKALIIQCTCYREFLNELEVVSQAKAIDRFCLVFLLPDTCRTEGIDKSWIVVKIVKFSAIEQIIKSLRLFHYKLG